MLAYLVITNLLHGLIALLWLSGVLRLARPLPASLRADLLTFGLALPPLALALAALDLAPPPADWVLLRADRWTAAVGEALPPFRFGVWALVIGTAALFVIQELLTSWRQHRPMPPPAPAPERVHRATRDITRAYTYRVGWSRRRWPPLHWTDDPRPVAALPGLLRPRLVLSRGLVDRLDDEELRATVAHELAHLSRAGNLGMLLVWLLRVLQAGSPAALVLFRHLLEERELACDALATEATGQPAALASALLVATRHGLGDSAAGEPSFDAPHRIQRRAEVASARARVRALLDGPVQHTTPPWVAIAAAAPLAVVLWLVR